MQDVCGAYFCNIFQVHLKFISGISRTSKYEINVTDGSSLCDLELSVRFLCLLLITGMASFLHHTSLVNYETKKKKSELHRITFLGNSRIFSSLERSILRSCDALQRIFPHQSYFILLICAKINKCNQYMVQNKRYRVNQVYTIIQEVMQ